jgi:hypothetical protein
MDNLQDLFKSPIFIGVAIVVIVLVIYKYKQTSSIEPFNYDYRYTTEYTKYPRAIANFLVRNYSPEEANEIFYKRFGRNIEPNDLIGLLTLNEKRNFNRMRSNSRRDVLGMPSWQ